MSKIPAKVKRSITELPPEGSWWHASGQDEFEAIAADLLEAGVDTDRVVNVLERAFGAVASEYGD